MAGPDPKPPLTGRWGGDRAMLTIDKEGGRLEEGSAYSWFKGEIHADPDGNFHAEGHYQLEGPGPQRAQSRPLRASFTGTIRGDALELVVERDGVEPRRFAMEAGRFVRLFRCL